MLISKEQYKMTDDRTLIMEHCNDIKDLLSQSYWAKERPLEVIKKSIEQSISFAVFDTEEDKIIAFARVVTDYATMYYICDVIVDEKHRGNGLGKMLIDRIVNKDDRLRGKYGMLLTSDAQGLYSQFGFKEYEQSCMCKFR